LVRVRNVERLKVEKIPTLSTSFDPILTAQPSQVCQQ
jgi:hypothetical protein